MHDWSPGIADCSGKLRFQVPHPVVKISSQSGRHGVRRGQVTFVAAAKIEVSTRAELGESRLPTTNNATSD